MIFKRLLAKNSASPDHPQERETLQGHVMDVVATANALTNAVGDACLESLGLQAQLGPDTLSRAVARGALLHDLGKANHQFQRMIRRPSHGHQALRHEWISAWLVLKFPELEQWLFNGCPDFVRYAVVAAALGHHLKAEDGSAISAREASGDTNVTVFCDHSDFRTLLKIAGRAFCLCEPQPLPAIKIDLLCRPLAELKEWLLDTSAWHRNTDGHTQRFVALVKALVIAADVAGSALPKQGIEPGRWAQEVLGRVCTAKDLRGIANTRLGQCRPRAFQEDLEESKGRVTFVKAGCGSGKTAAAYLWGANQAAGRKLFFCYPTTGTATEGYRDYIIPSEMAADAALLHSRSEMDLENILVTDGDNALERAIRIEALAAWDMPLVICTADQVLGLIQNNRRALFAFPSIGNGAFVFDEIHQYDDRLFAALLRFLDAFRGAPTLLMTASLPRQRLRAIHNVLGCLGTTLEIISGPTDLEWIKRYALSGFLSAPPWVLVRQTLNEKGKVLWVANTVDRAVNFAKEASNQGLAPILLYHSRYRYCDRIEKHVSIVSAFKNRGSVLAVTTQVCEVSLDLSADLLISDVAPIPALIQRLGRLNRRVTSEAPGDPRPAFFLEPDSALPYEKTDLETAKRWLFTLGSGSLSQADLAGTFESNIQAADVLRIESAWLDGGPFTRPAPLREAGVTISIIRAEDEGACLDKNRRPITKEIIRHAIPMTLGPVAREISGWKQLGFIFVAPSGRVDYSKEWGARWA